MTKLQWGQTYQNYLITQFQANKLDPTKTSRGDGDEVVAAVGAEEHSILHPFLAEPKGTKRDNTIFLKHYRKAAGEYFKLRGLEGIRRQGQWLLVDVLELLLSSSSAHSFFSSSWL